MRKNTVFYTPVAKSVFRWASSILLKLSGWKVVGKPPRMPKYVMIAAPHTSNWDFYYTMLIAFALDIKVYWMGKDSLFRGPAGVLFRWLGGIAIDRSRSNNMVAELVKVFNDSDELVVAVPPEGTRSKTRSWKTGFYHIARGAGVPVVFCFLDFRLKVGGMGPMFIPTGEVEEDMKLIQAFYRNITGKHPDRSDGVEVLSETYQPVDYTPLVSDTDSVLRPSGDLEADTLMLQAYYAGMTGQVAGTN